MEDRPPAVAARAWTPFLMVWGLGFRVWFSCIRACRIQGLGASCSPAKAWGWGFQIWGFPRSGATFMGIPILRMIAFGDRDWGTLNRKPYTSLYIPTHPYISPYTPISLYNPYNPYITPYITPYSPTSGNCHLGYPGGCHAQDRDAAKFSKCTSFPNVMKPHSPL